MKNVIKIFYINLLLLNVAYAQDLLQQPIVNSPIAKAESFFKTAIRQQSRLYNGTGFQDYGPSVDGSANFQNSRLFYRGTVIYDGFRYDSIPMVYNLHEDKLISYFNTPLSMYGLITEKISDFYLNGHHFKYIHIPNENLSTLQSGIYDLIYDGRSKILVKRSKKMQVMTENYDLRYYFVPKTTYYIQQGQRYEEISTEESFLSFLKDKKNELKKYSRAHKIKFKKEPEESIVLLITYYESLLD
ncbi:MAG: hypothetical protein V4541_05985 [Bacteroidota bacterium]